MKKILISVLALLSFANASNIDFNALSLQAKKENKHILVFFHSPGCGFCTRMQRNTLNTDAVKTKIKNNFIYVDINIDDYGVVLYKDFRGSRGNFARYLDYDVYPSVVFIDGKNEMIYAQAGYQDRETFSKILSYINARAYEDMGIEEFKETN